MVRPAVVYVALSETLRVRALSSLSATGFDVALENPDNVGFRGEVAEWLMAADCKSALLRVRWFESSPLHQRFTEQVKCNRVAGVAQW